VVTRVLTFIVLSIGFSQASWAEKDCRGYLGTEYQECSSANRCRVEASNAQDDMEKHDTLSKRMAQGVAAAKSMGQNVPLEEIKKFSDETQERYSCVQQEIAKCLESCQQVKSDDPEHRKRLDMMRAALGSLERNNSGLKDISDNVALQMSQNK